MNDRCNIFIYSIITAQHLLNKPLDKRESNKWVLFLSQHIIRKTKKPFWKNENGKSGREEGKTKTESSPTRTQKKDSV